MTHLKSITAAVLLDIAATYFLLDIGESTAHVAVYLGMHFVACALLATATLGLFPEKYRQPREYVIGLVFAFTFFIPLLGVIGILTAVFVTGLLPRIQAPHPFSELRAPEYVLSIRDPESNFRMAGLRATLLDPGIPTELRMRSLNALQNMPSRVSAPALRMILGDPADDVRLVAFGILDQKEKAINAGIQEETTRLEDLKSADKRLNTLRHLAELNWELVYSLLVQGDVRRHTLNRVLFYIDKALQIAPGDAGLWLLKGRTLHALDSIAEANAAYAIAASFGLPDSRVIPYLAEIAYENHDFAQVRNYFARIAENQVTTTMSKLVGYWSPQRTKVLT